MAAKTYYEILGVEPTATPKEIARARRRLSDMNHPDKVAHLAPKFKELAEEETKAINAAYDVLKDPQKRADYDRKLADQCRAEENQQQAEEAQRRREAEARDAEERRRREEESRQQENRHYGDRPNYPSESVTQTTGTNSRLWFTLSIIIAVIAFAVPLPLLGMLFSYLAMRLGRRTGGMVMMVINGVLVIRGILIVLVLLDHPVVSEYFAV